MKKILILLVFLFLTNFCFSQKIGFIKYYEQSKQLNIEYTGDIYLEGLIFDANTYKQGADYIDKSNKNAINIVNKKGVKIVIRNCIFKFFNKPTSRAVFMKNVIDSELVIENCFFESMTSGVQIWNSTFKSITFTKNFYKNQTANNSGGLTSMFQLVDCGANPNIEVSENKVQAFPNSGAIMGDVINFINSGGTKESRAIIKNNWFKCVPIYSNHLPPFDIKLGIAGTFNSGGCCIVCDKGSFNIDVINNIIINYNAFGIQVVATNGANNNRVIGNKVLLEPRYEIINGVITGSWLAIQTSNAIIGMENNLAYCKRLQQPQNTFIFNSVYPTINGITNSPSNKKDKDSLDGLNRNIIPDLLITELLLYKWD